MNDHHLDDLIIGDPEPGGGKSKTLLTIIALAIVIMIIALILWALLSDPSTQDTNTSAQEQQTKPLSPDLIPIDNTNQEIPVSKPKPKLEPKPKPKPAEETKVPKPPAQTPAQTETKPTVEPKPKPKPAEETKVPKPSAQTPAQTETKPATTSQGGKLIKNADKTVYYIQVGAFKRDPNPKFLKKLKDAGFTFITKTKNGIRRVRVGPYDGYQDAKAALPKVKAKIGVDGLIVKY